MALKGIPVVFKRKVGGFMNRSAFVAIAVGWFLLLPVMTFAGDSSVGPATASQKDHISSGFVSGTGCQPIEIAYTKKVDNGDGYLVAGVLNCLGVEGEVATWYTSANEGVMMILSLDAETSAMTVWPRKRGAWNKEKGELEQYTKAHRTTGK